MKGWEGKPGGWWVEDGAITSRSTKEKPCVKHHYLYWNDYEITAKGSKIALKINGQLMCEVDDRDAKLACRKGIIALQMHPGPPMEVQFRDLRIRVFD